jgi:TRAP-type C4-dicarboxylate transport system substrate-binding protein
MCISCVAQAAAPKATASSPGSSAHLSPAEALPPLAPLRIVGNLANTSLYTRFDEPFWARDITRLSGGRIRAEVVPFDQAGVRASDMLRFIQVGAIPFGTVLLAQASALDPELGASDLAGLNPDLASLKRNFAAFRPHLEKRLRERWGVEVLAVYAYPAQVAFCKRPFGSLAELAGRRVRSPSGTTSDLLQGIGAVPVLVTFADIMPAMQAGFLDCAVTDTMSGNAMGLHEITTHVHALAVSWGVGVLSANQAAWNALPTDAQMILRRELPHLERAIWDEAQRDTTEGLLCNSGQSGCVKGRNGRMTVVKETENDVQRRKEVFRSTVLPSWIKRCGPDCADIWNRTLRQTSGFEALASAP